MPSKRQIDRLLDQLEPRAARAFARAVAGIRSRARLAELEAAIVAQDLDRAVRAAGLTPAAWVEVTEESRLAYLQGGALMAADAPSRFGFSFDLNNPRAQTWLANHSSELVTYIMEDQRAMIRSTLAAGFEQGRNPRSVALDIVGRVDSVAKRRTGGLVGLTQQQAGYVNRARQQLENLDPEYFTRQRRDRRFDRQVQRAIDEGKPLTAAQVNKITGRYSDRLLNLRGENIARTEMLGSLNEGLDEALRQVVDEGLVEPGGVRRIWDATGDSRTRPDHVAAEGQEVGLDEPFIVGGESMMHPGDFGASPGNVINCRCAVRQRVDWIAQA